MVELHSLAEAYNYIKRDKYLVTDQAWVLDQRRKYNPGDISEKTGLEKQPDGTWKEPKNKKSIKAKEQSMATKRTPQAMAHLNNFIKEEFPGGVCSSLKEFKHYANAFEYKPGRKITTVAGVDIGPQIKNGIEELKTRCKGKFKSILVVNNKKALQKDVICEIFKVPPFENVLLINGNSNFWNDEQLRMEFIKNNCSTTNPNHFFIHEYGHNKLESLPDKWDNKVDEEIAYSLSHNASFSPDEFQAELYAAKRSGKKIPVEIKKLYKKYGGSYESL